MEDANIADLIDRLGRHLQAVMDAIIAQDAIGRDYNMQVCEHLRAAIAAARASQARTAS